MAKPLIKWAGSKRRILPLLAEHWGQGHRRYVEPFAGSACFFFHLSPTLAVLGDLNGELIDTYGQVRENPEDVYFALASISNDPVTYYRMRAIKPATLPAIQRAARFLYLNRYCFNGLYRTNLSGDFNVPYGGKRSGAIPSFPAFMAASEELRRAELHQGDFDSVLSLVEPGDFVYLDPPYRVKSRRVFREYDGSTFSENDLGRLRAWLERLASRNIRFLVSYAESSEARVLAEGFNTRRVRVRRNIAGFAGDRRVSSELLIFN
jgi:DNA adenine methylase